ncbi:MAG: flagellar biosynthesis anti-sigma factor FlgM [Candidatus Hydrogenedentota bacterium]|nr:MAG: flagellar biosynthesis anti-sigma factor FlgM [Candidatus Hydrogenedentota bacterium]
MDVGKIDGVQEPSLNQPRQEEQRRRRAEEVQPNDRVNISPEAKKAAEVARLVSLVKQIPDTRQDKVAEARARIQSQAPEDERVNRTVARRLLEDLL